VPVDDAVAVTYDDRFIYLISGWHDLGNVNLVQRYDTYTDQWVQATPTPGQGVFGNAGGIVGNTIVYCDGVAVRPHTDRRRDFVVNNECFIGLIDADNSRRIDWRTLPSHPGLPRYRVAAAGIDELKSVVFVGGSDNPYNYDGIAYNGEPSQPISNILRYDLERQAWTTFSSGAAGSMDHRGLVRYRNAWLTVGGMLRDQRVTDRVVAYTFE
ncbi:MAG: galactose oxidase, partial [Gammaproteobacteria bacterium]|nr:galactose oxidase [Gammaproteobacteria bacterium]